MAYRKGAKAHHPDKGGDTSAFNRLTVAYSTLKDEDARARYDATGEERSTTRDPVEEKARELIGLILSELLNDDALLSLDFVAQILDGIKAAKRVIDDGVDKLGKVEAKLKRLKKARKKLRFKDSGGLVVEIIDAKIVQTETSFRSFKLEVEQGKKALARAKKMIDSGEFAYDPDPPDLTVKPEPAQQPGFLDIGELLAQMARSQSRR